MTQKEASQSHHAPDTWFILWASVSGLLLMQSLSPLVRAAQFIDPSALPTNKSYDYIVIGAGAGGSVLASRISEDTSTNVLLIEAGPSDAGVLPIEIPFLGPTLQPNKEFDWNYTTVPQHGLGGRVVPYPRGRVLGGSTSINYMVYTRGSKDDYDKYAELSGDHGWSWDALQPYFKKIENLVPPTDGHNTSGQIDPSIHGTSGPLQISISGVPVPLDPHITQTTVQLPEEFSYNVDMNSGNPLGIGWDQSAIGAKGERSSASVAYIYPVLGRDNLDVLVNTTVTKVLQTGVKAGKPDFSGVEFSQSTTSPRFTRNATKEVILAAGAVNTPQILLLSGLGPVADLHAHGITPVLDLPDVGKHLVDHPSLTSQFGVADAADDVVDVISRNATLTNELIQQWSEDGTGAMTATGLSRIGWLRIPENDSVFKTEEDPAAGPLSPHYELLFGPGYLTLVEPVPTTGYFMTFVTVIVTPTSRGSVTLASASPFTPPTVDPNLLGTAFDRAAMRYAVRSALRFAAAPTWDGFLTGQADKFAAVNASSDAQLDAWARAQTGTIWHPVGTARMGRCADAIGHGSVVDPDLRVRGVHGLRVVDASVLPLIPAAHPQAAVYVFAERVADLIKSGKSTCY